jgi:hypothetical protein
MNPKKKVASLPILVLDSRSRFADLSFHSQLWLQVMDSGSLDSLSDLTASLQLTSLFRNLCF